MSKSDGRKYAERLRKAKFIAVEATDGKPFQIMFSRPDERTQEMFAELVERLLEERN